MNQRLNPKLVMLFQDGQAARGRTAMSRESRGKAENRLRQLLTLMIGRYALYVHDLQENIPID